MFLRFFHVGVPSPLRIYHTWKDSRIFPEALSTPVLFPDPTLKIEGHRQTPAGTSDCRKNLGLA